MADFEEIYRDYFNDVYRYALSLTCNEDMAEEITQETFFKALRSIDGFKGDCKIRVWLCQIAKNTYFSHLKKGKRLSYEMEESADKHSIEEMFVDSENVFEIHKHIHRLTEPYREVFTLRLFGELSYSQIAELFGKTESWARVTYHRAKSKLQEDLS